MATMEIEEALAKVGRDLQEHLRSEPIARKDLVRAVVALTGCSPDSVLPSDFTYNLVNKAGFSCERPIFIRKTRGRYLFVGRNYRYDGLIYWTPAGGKERVVGTWRDGKPTFSADPRS